MKRIKYFTGLLLFCLMLGSVNLQAQVCPTISLTPGPIGSVTVSAVTTGTLGTPTFSWAFGNNTFASGQTATGIYTSNGVYTITLNFTNSPPFFSCSSTTTLFIGNTCALNINAIGASSGTICNGTATVSSTGMCASPGYTWSNGAIGNTVSGLCGGSVYTVIASALGTNCCQFLSGVISIGNNSCNLTANFQQYMTPILTGSTIPFYSTSTGTTVGTTYVWKWGDGSTSIGASATHSWVNASNYPVELVATRPGCKDSVVKPILITNGICNLNASFTVGINNPTSGIRTFISTSSGTVTGTTYSWNFGDSTPAGNTPTVTHTYTANNNYLVTLTANNNFTTGFCQSTATVSVPINIVVPCNLVASFLSQTSSVGINGFVSTSTGTISGSSYNWNFGDNTAIGTGQNSAHTYSAPGNYLVTLFVQNSVNCVSSYTSFVSANISVPCNINANFTHTVGTSGLVNFSSNSTGVNNLTVYSWDFGDGVYGAGGAPSHNYLYNGAYNVRLIASETVPFCSDTMVYSVNVTGLPCVANSIFSVSPGGTPQYWLAIPVYPWNVTAATWDWGDGSSSNLLYTSHVYSVAGTYNICLSVSVACGATASTCVGSTIFRSQNGEDSQTMVYVNTMPPGLVSGIAANGIAAVSCFIYPNPSNGEFRLTATGLGTGPVKIGIYNLVGDVVHEIEPEVTSGEFIKEINLGSIRSGIYFIRMNSGDGLFVKKIVVQDQ